MGEVVAYMDVVNPSGLAMGDTVCWNDHTEMGDLRCVGKIVGWCNAWTCVVVCTSPGDGVTEHEVWAKDLTRLQPDTRCVVCDDFVDSEFGFYCVDCSNERGA